MYDKSLIYLALFSRLKYSHFLTNYSLLVLEVICRIQYPQCWPTSKEVGISFSTRDNSIFGFVHFFR